MCCVWDESQSAYVLVVDADVPMYPGEFVDAVRVEFDRGVRYFIARQLDELIATISEDGWNKLVQPNGEHNFWFEEI